jgi:hypothetical protein
MLGYQFDILDKIRLCKNLKKSEQALVSLMQKKGAELIISDFIESNYDNKFFFEVAFLISCSKCPSMLVRDSSAIALGISESKDPRVNKALAVMINDRSWIVRCSAIYSLGLRRSLENTNNIISRYKSWSFIEKEWVLMSLIKMGDPNAKGFLQRIYKFSQNKDRKYLAASGLCVLGDKYACEYIVSEGNKKMDTDLKITYETCMDLINGK